VTSVNYFNEAFSSHSKQRMLWESTRGCNDWGYDAYLSVTAGRMVLCHGKNVDLMGKIDRESSNSASEIPHCQCGASQPGLAKLYSRMPFLFVATSRIACAAPSMVRLAQQMEQASRSHIDGQAFICLLIGQLTTPRDSGI
jgi:hypothetical protein